MTIVEVGPGPASLSNGEAGRDYLLKMIKSLAALARRSHEEEMAVLLEAIVPARKLRERQRD